MENRKNHLHLCTVATEETKGLRQLLDSCEQNGFLQDIHGPVVLGLGTPFLGFTDKLIQVQKYLEKLPDNDVVLFVDAYDVVVLKSPEVIYSTFLAMNAPFVISADRICWPYHHLASEYPPSPTSFRYINAGSYIGYVGYIKELFKELAPLIPEEDDQGLMTKHFLRHPEKYTLDYHGKLFLPTAGLSSEDLEIDKQNKTVRSVETGTTPCILHGNGFSPWYQYTYDSLYSEFYSQDKTAVSAKETKTVFIAILVSNTTIVLRKYLRSITDLMYNKKLITIYINTFNNGDATEEILEKWVEENRGKYKEIIFESEGTVGGRTLDWTAARFQVPSAIRNKSIKRAKEAGYDFYFAVDGYSFITPFTLKELISKDKPIVAPMLRNIPEVFDYPGNYFCDCTLDGQYKEHTDQYKIFSHEKIGLFRVAALFSTYLIKKEFLGNINYLNGEGAIFSKNFQTKIDQYICNEKNFGVLIHFYKNLTDEQKARFENFLQVSMMWRY